jgi:hypothetical protein
MYVPWLLTAVEMVGVDAIKVFARPKEKKTKKKNKKTET